MERFKRTIIILLLVFGLLPEAVHAKSATILLQEGIYAEQTEGDLEKAISLYKQVLEQYKDVERLAARATYQLGMCHLKKGDKGKAAEYFQEVVSYYPEQTTIVKKAQDQLNKIKPASTNQDDQAQVISYLREQHIRAYHDAKKTGINLNSIAYYVDESCVKIQGGFITFDNNSGAIIDSEISVGNFGRKNIIELYNEKLEPQQFRFEDTGKSTGRYALKWTPDRAINPGETVILIYKLSEEALPKTSNGCRLEMTNHFGSEVLENFFLILPANMKITDGLDNLTSHKRIDNFDVYLWQKRVPANTTNSKLLDIEIDKEHPDAAKPGVTDSFPKTYSNDIDPDINEITVTFDQDMFQYGWAWCKSVSDENYPEVTGTPKYIDSRTCVLPVKVKPAGSYLVLINSGPYRSFRNTDEIPAREYAIVFATKDAYGNPTEISGNLLKKAEDINSRNAAPEPVLDIVPAAVRAYIADTFYETHYKAQEKGLRTNSHVHIIDEDFNRDFGMVQIFKNSTGQIIDHEIPMGSNDSPEMYIYDEKGVRQKIRTYKKIGSNYRYFWTPSEPIEPDETRMLFYSAGTSKLSVDEYNKATLKMNNHYGSPVIESFYVVLPSKVELAYQSEVFTSHETIEGFDIYCWSKEQGRNVQHRVDLKLASSEPLKPGDVNMIVEKAVKTISTCAEGDARVDAAIATIKSFDESAVVNELKKYLTSENNDIRRSAIYVLWRGEFANIDAAVADLEKLCSHEEDLTRGMAGLALGENKVTSSFTILKEMTLDDPSGYARRCGAYALGLIGDAKAMPILEKALKDPDRLVQNNAEAAITMLKN